MMYRKFERIVHEEKIDVGVIAVPARAAQRVLNQIMAAGASRLFSTSRRRR